MNDDERMAGALQAHPEIGDRTARYLAGELEEGPVAGDLAQIVFRLPSEKLKKSFEDRADTLIPALEAADPDGRRVTRAEVYRKALRLGLAQLESEHLPKSKTKRKR